MEHESSYDRNKTLSIKYHLAEIKPYLKDIINNLKKSDKWKNLSSKGTDEGLVMHLKSDNREIMIYDKENEIIK